MIPIDFRPVGEHAVAAGCAEEVFGFGREVQADRVLRVCVAVTIETTDRVAFSKECGGRAVVKGRSAVTLADLPVFGAPSWLVWRQRRWACPHSGCEARSQME